MTDGQAKAIKDLYATGTPEFWIAAAHANGIFDSDAEIAAAAAKERASHGTSTSWPMSVTGTCCTPAVTLAHSATITSMAKAFRSDVAGRMRFQEEIQSLAEPLAVICPVPGCESAYQLYDYFEDQDRYRVLLEHRLRREHPHHSGLFITID